MSKIIDRTGEEKLNNFGSKIIVSAYRSAKDVDIYFPEYDWTSFNIGYKNFKTGGVKCPYEPRVYGHGCFGEGKYKASINGKTTKCYRSWSEMLKRCFDDKYQEKFPTYKDVTIHESWLNYQTFGNWFDDNFYQVPDDWMCLDKDILVKGNKIYSPDTCIFVPNRINLLFLKRKSQRGNLPIGVHYRKDIHRYMADGSDSHGKSINLGHFTNPTDAFNAYKRHREQLLKDVIDEYENIIPEPYYSKLKHVMYNYKVEITD